MRIVPKPVDAFPLPAEVEDLIAEHGGAARASSLTFAAAAGHVVVAGCAPGPAFLFACGANAATAEALPLDLPRSAGGPASDSAPPALELWPAASAVHVAALSGDGALRVYSCAAPGAPTPGPREVRLAKALAASAGGIGEGDGACVALRVVHIGGNCLVVLGSRGSAVMVEVREGVLATKALVKAAEADDVSGSSLMTGGGSAAFGFFSALRGVVGGARRIDDADWMAGTGDHAIVGVGKGSGASAFSIRRGGDVDKWGPEGLLWSCDINAVAGHCFPSGSTACAVLAAEVSAEDVLASLVQFDFDGRTHLALVCLSCDGGRGNPPVGPELFVDMGEMVCAAEDVRMVLSSGIVFAFLGSTGVVHWTSISRGIPIDRQVRGQYEIDVNTLFIGAVDCCRGLAVDIGIVGGYAGFVESNRVVLMSAQVPGPISSSYSDAEPTQFSSSGGVGRDASGVLDATKLLFRTYLQYAGGHIGAAEATIRTLVTSSLDSSGRPDASFLDKAAIQASLSIVDTPPKQALGGSPALLLVDSQLESKVSRHGPLLAMLADAKLLVACDYAGREDGDRLWDLLSDRARALLVANAEKLAAAARLRGVQNSHAARLQSRRTGAGERASVAGGSERSLATSAMVSLFGSAAGTEADDAMFDGEESLQASIVSQALSIAGAQALELVGVDVEQPGALGDDSEVALYGLISSFDGFLPALRSCIVAIVARSKESRPHEDGYEDDERAAAVAARVRRLACRDILLASEGALAVVEAAMEVREEAQATYSYELVTMEPGGGWSCHATNSRAVLNDLVSAALEAAEACRPIEAKALRKCACNVSRVLLDCARNSHLEEQLRSGSPGGNPSLSPAKRRRRAKGEDLHSIWGQERRAALTVLRNYGMDKEAFDLALKYEDFGMMLALKCDSDDFDSFFESAVEDFGREFAFFAFQWLENKGEIKLLVFGRRGGSNVGRSPVVKKLLLEYFRRERASMSNFAWMLHLSSGEFRAAADGLSRQAHGIAVPGKEASLPNARLLVSVAKLALHCARSKRLGSDSPRQGADGDLDAVQEDIDRRLYLLRAQDRLDCTDNAVLPYEELVRQFIVSAPVESSSLAENVVLALEALTRSNLPSSQTRNLRNFVWQKCVQRQTHFWVAIVAGARAMGDEELRRQLRNTAMFEAARSVSLKANDVRDMALQGVFNINLGTGEATPTGSAQAGNNLSKLVETTVLLAEAEAKEEWMQGNDAVVMPPMTVEH